MTDYAIQMWNAGSLVHWTWHMCRPDWGDANCCYAAGSNDGCNGNHGISGSYNSVSNDEWQQLVSKSGDYWNKYTAMLDNVIPYFQQMIRNGTVPIFRLHHELNMEWAWWQNKQYGGTLWQNGIEYIESKVGQGNIVWMWNMQDDTTNDWSLFYPPNKSYMDICGLDTWDEDPYGKDCGGNHPDIPNSKFYDLMKQHCPSQPIGLGEVGLLPQPSVLTSQKWAWFMVWADFVYECGNGEGENPVKNLIEIYQNTSRQILNQGDFQLNPSSNIALRKPCLASGTDSPDRTCDKAFDGDFTTRWSSNYTEQNWIYVDLGSEMNINLVKLYWEDAYAKGFQIQISNDQTTWKTVYENDQGVGGLSSIPLSGVSAQWVKMYAYVRATDWGYSLWEFQIY
eukprot:TRINITY_DN8256_c0_g1_i1.p1 TRINITY_DN8256_c0_g1~~TRINITY_DN8256_c0_g1_i1.p1  ORF type:complete len:403 (-),score=58.39 TRINITY_DN8256_c0_g1_i1:46-1230(-)